MDLHIIPSPQEKTVVQLHKQRTNPVVYPAVLCGAIIYVKCGLAVN